MPQAQLETIKVANVIPITEGKRYCMVLSYDQTTVDVLDYAAFDEWLQRLCELLSESVNTWLAGEDPCMVVGLPQNVTVTFERVPEEGAEDGHTD